LAIATLTSKGQITIPKKVRDAAHLNRGDQVVFRVRDDGVIEMASASVDLLSLAGVLKPSVRGVTLREMDETIREEGCRR